MLPLRPKQASASLSKQVRNKLRAFCHSRRESQEMLAAGHARLNGASMQESGDKQTTYPRRLGPHSQSQGATGGWSRRSRLGRFVGASVTHPNPGHCPLCGLERDLVESKQCRIPTLF